MKLETIKMYILKFNRNQILTERDFLLKNKCGIKF